MRALLCILLLAVIGCGSDKERLMVDGGGPRGIVTFTADGADAEVSSAVNILEAHGVAGTCYTLASNADWWRVKSYQKHSGWEIGCRGLNWEDLRDVPNVVLEIQLYEALEAFEAQGLEPVHFAVPRGLYDDRVLGVIAKYFESNRTLDRGTNDKRTDPYKLKYVTNLSNELTISELVAIVDRSISTNQWAILRVGGAGALAISDATLDSLVTYTIESRAELLTVGAALEKLGH